MVYKVSSRSQQRATSRTMSFKKGTVAKISAAKAPVKVSISPVNANALAKGTSFKVGSVGNTVGAPSAKPSTFKSGTYAGSSFSKNPVPKSSFKSFGTLTPQPISKATLTPTKVPILGASVQKKAGTLTKPGPGFQGGNLKIQPPNTMIRKPTLPVAAKKSSSSGSGGSGGGKVVSVPQDKANKYFQANPGARAKDYAPSNEKITIKSVPSKLFSTPSPMFKTITPAKFPTLGVTIHKPTKQVASYPLLKTNINFPTPPTTPKKSYPYPLLKTDLKP